MKINEIIREKRKVLSLTQEQSYETAFQKDMKPFTGV